MELKDILQDRNIRIGAEAGNKLDALRQMCDVLEENGLVTSAEAFYADVLEREKLGPTCIGSGVAIPHGKSAQAKQPTVVVFKLTEGVPWESHMSDDEKADVVILFCVSDDNEGAQEHLKLIAEVARKLAHEENLEALHKAESAAGIVAAFS